VLNVDGEVITGTVSWVNAQQRNAGFEVEGGTITVITNGNNQVRLVYNGTFVNASFTSVTRVSGGGGGGGGGQNQQNAPIGFAATGALIDPVNFIDDAKVDEPVNEPVCDGQNGDDGETDGEDDDDDGDDDGDE
jgi:hypothetical protein